MTTTAVPDLIAPADVAAQAAAAERDARTFVSLNKVDVTDLGSLEHAVLVRSQLAEMKARIVEKLKEPKAWAHKLHRWFCDLENSALTPLEQLDLYERGQISTYKAEQDRIRQQRERELAEARRWEEQDRAAAVAAAFESDGQPEIAAAVIAEAIAAPVQAVVLPDATKAVEGLKFRRDYKWRYLTSEARALELVPRAFLAIDEKKLTAYAKAMKGAGQVPGIEFFHEDIPVR
jgi:hypothetical protein